MPLANLWENRAGKRKIRNMFPLALFRMRVLDVFATQPVEADWHQALTSSLSNKVSFNTKI